MLVIQVLISLTTIFGDYMGRGGGGGRSGGGSGGGGGGRGRGRSSTRALTPEVKSTPGKGVGQIGSLRDRLTEAEVIKPTGGNPIAEYSYSDLDNMPPTTSIEMANVLKAAKSNESKSGRINTADISKTLEGKMSRARIVKALTTAETQEKLVVYIRDNKIDYKYEPRLALAGVPDALNQSRTIIYFEK